MMVISKLLLKDSKNLEKVRRPFGLVKPLFLAFLCFQAEFPLFAPSQNAVSSPFTSANITFHHAAQHLSCCRTVRRVGGNVASALTGGAPTSLECDKSGRGSGWKEAEEHPGSSFKNALRRGVGRPLNASVIPLVPGPLPPAGIPRGPGWRAESEKSGRRWLPSPSRQPTSDPPPPLVRLSQPIRADGG